MPDEARTSSFAGEAVNSVDAEVAWRQALRDISMQVMRPEELVADAPVLAGTDGEVSVPVVEFARCWREDAKDPWRAVVESAATLNPSVLEELTPTGLLAPLRHLIGRAERAAVVWGHPLNWTSPNEWGYLLQVRSRRDKAEREHILLHPPATQEHIRQTEHALGMALPPSYRRFLTVTNGFGLGATENSYICGAGPDRADWNKVVLNLWMECSGQHEITASWREFQGIYAYERIRDRENGEDTFQSDEAILVPFANTYEQWCFDRTRRNINGEYPVMLWDHELREATDEYPDFATWFAGEVEPYLFGEDRGDYDDELPSHT